MATESAKPKKRRLKPDNPAQSKKFLDAAKALGLDTSPKGVARAMDKVLKPKRGSS